MTEKQFNLRAGYYDEYTGICGGGDENFTTNEVVDLLNEQDEQIQELLSCNHGLAQKQIRMLDRLIQLEKENKQLKEELESFEQINFTDMCDGTSIILYMKKENVGDSE